VEVPAVENTLTAVRHTRTPDGSARGAALYSNLMTTIREKGLLERRTGFYIAVFLVLTAAFAAAIAGMALLGNSWFQLLIAAGLGLIFTQFAFLAHEAAHRQIFSSGKTNDRWGRFIAVFIVGLSYAWWMNKHTKHHSQPNVVGKDPDIEKDTISFLEEDAAASRGFNRVIARKQGYLFFPLLTLEGLNLHKYTVQTLLGKGKVKGRALELVFFITRMALYLGVVFWLMPVGVAFAFLGVQLAIFGLYMGASFAPNHKGMPILANNSNVDFLRRQVLTSRNVSGGSWVDYFMGGLNHQVEHHLFPTMPRPHLRHTKKVVQKFCAENNIPVILEAPTLGDSEKVWNGAFLTSTSRLVLPIDEMEWKTQSSDGSSRIHKQTFKPSERISTIERLVNSAVEGHCSNIL
jgi:fatty acid desaturase